MHLISVMQRLSRHLLGVIDRKLGILFQNKLEQIRFRLEYSITSGNSFLDLFCIFKNEIQILFQVIYVILSNAR